MTGLAAHRAGEEFYELVTDFLHFFKTIRMSYTSSPKTKELGGMKTFKLASVLAIIITILGLLALPLSAVNAATVTKTITITQDQINSSYRVTNPRNRKVSNVSVTIEDGQVSIAATITQRGQQPVDTVSVWKPVLLRGVVYWKLDSATIGGKPATKAMQNLLLVLHRITLRNLVWQLIRRGLASRVYRVTNVTLTPGTVSITATVFGVKAAPAATPAATQSAK